MSLFDKDLINPTVTVNEVNRQSDLGALLSATKRLEAPGQAVSRHHLVMIVIVIEPCEANVTNSSAHICSKG